MRSNNTLGKRRRASLFASSRVRNGGSARVPWSLTKALIRARDNDAAETDSTTLSRLHACAHGGQVHDEPQLVVPRRHRRTSAGGREQRFARTIGVTWGPIIDGEAPFFDNDGDTRTIRLRFSYSLEAPHLELIEEVSGTPWVCNEFSNLHHVGFFSDDVDAQSHELVDVGCSFELGARAGHAEPMMFAYNRDDLGVRFEFVSETRRHTIDNVYSKAAASK